MTGVLIFLIAVTIAALAFSQPLRWWAVAWWAETLAVLLSLIVFGFSMTVASTAVFAVLWALVHDPAVWDKTKQARRSDSKRRRVIGEAAYAVLTGANRVVDRLERQHVRCVWRVAMRVLLDTRTPRERTVRRIGMSFAMVLSLPLMLIFAVVFGAILAILLIPALLATRLLMGPRRPRIERKGVHRTRAGWQLTIRYPFAATAGDLSPYAHRLAAAYSCGEVRVHALTGDKRRGIVTIIKRDPLKDPIPWPAQLPGDIWQPVEIGHDEHGHPVSVTLIERHLLLGGESGSGKSVQVNVLIAHVAMDPHVTLIVLDGKHVDLQEWEKRASAYIGASLPAATARLLQEQQWMEDAYVRLAAQRRKKVEPGDPLRVIVIDELHFYTAGDDAATKKFNLVLRDLVARGRAAGLIVIAATQKPSVDTVPSAIRDLFQLRIAFRCMTDAASEHDPRQRLRAPRVRRGDRVDRPARRRVRVRRG